MLRRIAERCADCSDAGRRLCFFNASRNTPRYVLADKGSDGCESLLKYEEKEKDEVVGSVSGKGITVGSDQDFTSEDR
jgi:hypothetical protein